MDEPTQLSNHRPTPQEPDQPGKVIGAYTLIRMLGEGGFGTVYEAEQSQPITRRVALKLIKPGMGSRELLARFELERQALARMDHPHVAKVLDGGATADGRPFFVMELVEGETIVRYCSKHELGLAERMELLVQVCEAVQHAHGRGLIHRDLKPANVLVTEHDGHGFAKVIDFGIAKLVNNEVDGASPLTAINVLIGTPSYMSPEQAEGSNDIDTRTDVYALGVLLYELLTGSTPHDATTLGEASAFEIQRIIREVEPPTPSVRLHRWRETELNGPGQLKPAPEAHARRLRGELDWIVMKALEKDRERRYPTASELAADLRRHLAGQPVLAAPPSRLYRLRKLVGRHRLATAALLLFGLSLVAGAVGVVWQARIAAERANELAAVLEFEQALFELIEPAKTGAALTGDVLRRLDAALEESEPDPVARAEKRAAFEAAWEQIDATDTARALITTTLLQPAVAAMDARGEQSPRLEGSLRALFAERFEVFGDTEVAIAQARRAMDLQRRTLGATHRDTLQNEQTLIGMLRFIGRRDEAEPMARDALARARDALGDEDEITLWLLGELGSVIQEDGRLAEAEPYIRESYTAQRRLFGLDHYGTQISMNDLALLQHSRGRLAEAVGLYSELVESMSRTLGAEASETLTIRSNYASLLAELGDLATAEAIERELLETRQRVFGRRHADTLFSMMSLAAVLHAQERYTEAEGLLRSVVRGQATQLPATHPEAIRALWDLGDTLAAQEKLAEAEPHYRDALARTVETSGADHADALLIELDLATLLHRRGDAAGAETALAAREEIFTQRFADESTEVLGRYHQQRAMALQALGRGAEASAQLHAAAAAFLKAGEVGVEGLAEVQRLLAEGGAER